MLSVTPLWSIKKMESHPRKGATENDHSYFLWLFSQPVLYWMDFVAMCPAKPWILMEICTILGHRFQFCDMHLLLWLVESCWMKMLLLAIINQCSESGADIYFAQFYHCTIWAGGGWKCHGMEMLKHCSSTGEMRIAMTDPQHGKKYALHCSFLV